MEEDVFNIPAVTERKMEREEEVEEGIKVKYFLSSGAALRRRRHQFRVTPLKKKKKKERNGLRFIFHTAVRTYV